MSHSDVCLSENCGILGDACTICYYSCYYYVVIKGKNLLAGRFSIEALLQKKIINAYDKSTFPSG